MVCSVRPVAEYEAGFARRNLERKGFVGVEENKFFSMFEIAVGPSNTEEASQVITGIRTPDACVRAESGAPFWYSDPIFSHLKMGTSNGKARLERYLIQSLLTFKNAFLQQTPHPSSLAPVRMAWRVLWRLNSAAGP